MRNLKWLYGLGIIASIILLIDAIVNLDFLGLLIYFVGLKNFWREWQRSPP